MDTSRARQRQRTNTRTQPKTAADAKWARKLTCLGAGTHGNAKQCAKGVQHTQNTMTRGWWWTSSVRFLCTAKRWEDLRCTRHRSMEEQDKERISLCKWCAASNALHMNAPAQITAPRACFARIRAVVEIEGEGHDCKGREVEQYRPWSAGHSATFFFLVLSKAHFRHPQNPTNRAAAMTRSTHVTTRWRCVS